VNRIRSHIVVQILTVKVRVCMCVYVHVYVRVCARTRAHIHAHTEHREFKVTKNYKINESREFLFLLIHTRQRYKSNQIIFADYYAEIHLGQ